MDLSLFYLRSAVYYRDWSRYFLYERLGRYSLEKIERKYQDAVFYHGSSFWYQRWMSSGEEATGAKRIKMKEFLGSDSRQIRQDIATRHARSEMDMNFYPAHRKH